MGLTDSSEMMARSSARVAPSAQSRCESWLRRCLRSIPDTQVSLLRIKHTTGICRDTNAQVNRQENPSRILSSHAVMGHASSSSGRRLASLPSNSATRGCGGHTSAPTHVRNSAWSITNTMDSAEVLRNPNFSTLRLARGDSARTASNKGCRLPSTAPAVRSMPTVRRLSIQTSARSLFSRSSDVSRSLEIRPNASWGCKVCEYDVGRKIRREMDRER